MSSGTTTTTTTTGPSHVTETVSDRKKSRELAEARQSGAAAPEVDVKTGNMINPHNPEFITKRPWYLGGGDTGPSLDHQADQRAAEDRIELSMASADQLLREERRKRKEQRKKLKFKVGMWVEALKGGRKPYLICQIRRIAKKGTEFDLQYDDDGYLEKNVKFRREDRGSTNARIRFTKSGTRSFAIDHTKHGKETYDSKRDSYLGYDVTEGNQHMKLIQTKFNKREAMRREMNDHLQKSKKSNVDDNHDNNNNDNEIQSDEERDARLLLEEQEDDDEFGQTDNKQLFTSRLARQGGVGGAQMKMTARNLRIREDTAKYLRNLDLNSAYYDPKSRSMRNNPNPEVPDEDYQGDNFARISGDAVDLAQTQVFAWDSSKTDPQQQLNPESSSSVHVQANPSQTELMRKKFESKSKDIKALQRKAVLDKYGGAQYLDGQDGLASETNDITHQNKSNSTVTTSAQRKVRFGVNVVEEHYTRDGQLFNSGQGSTMNKMAKQKSKYEEDVFINGHTTVWGSYFHKGAFRWGYADDHSLLRNSYCTGANGRRANDQANEQRYGTGVAGSAQIAQAREMLKAIPKENRQSIPSNILLSSSKMYGEMEQQRQQFDSGKVKEAIKKQKVIEQELKNGGKRKYNSLDTGDQNEVTEEDMEAYRLTKRLADDPMAKLNNSEELLEYK